MTRSKKPEKPKKANKLISEQERELFLQAVSGKLVIHKYETVKNNTTKKYSKKKKVGSKDKHFDARIDLHGLFRGQARLRIKCFLDDSCIKNRKKLLIVHGRGSGILKKATLEILRNDSRVEFHTVAPAKWGGEGALIVTLR